MEISASYTLNKSADRVWEALMDPAMLSTCLPGVESLQPSGDNVYVATITIGVGFLKSRYKAKISLLDIEPKSSYRLVVDGSGSLGSAVGEARISLSEQNSATEVDVQGTAQVSGMAARVGDRTIVSTARGVLDRLMKCVEEAS